MIQQLIGEGKKGKVAVPATSIIHEPDEFLTSSTFAEVFFSLSSKMLHLHYAFAFHSQERLFVTVRCCARDIIYGRLSADEKVCIES